MLYELYRGRVIFMNLLPFSLAEITSRWLICLKRQSCVLILQLFAAVTTHMLSMDLFRVKFIPSTKIFYRCVMQHKLCNWLPLQCLILRINHLPPVCESTFWKVSYKQQLVCHNGERIDFVIFAFIYIQTYTYPNNISWYMTTFYLPHFHHSILFQPGFFVYTSSNKVFFAHFSTITRHKLGLN